MALLDEYLTAEQLAYELKVTTRTIWRWLAQPDGLPVTQIGGRTYFKRPSVEAWIAAHERHPNKRRRVSA